MSITKVEEYVNRFAISQNKYDVVDLRSYIDTYEKYYLIDLLGKELYDLFIADLDPITGLPVTPRFIDIYNEIYLDENRCNEVSISRGIPELLKDFVYFEYTREQQIKNTITGNVKSNNENSVKANNSSSRMMKLYNKGVDSFNVIAEYIVDNSATYPEYKGIIKEYIGYFY